MDSLREPSAGFWIDPDVIRQDASATTFQRGLALYRTGKVLDFDMEPLDDHWQLFGEVQGSAHYPYELNIEVWLDEAGEPEEWASDCSCPVGAQCKHAVALMLEAAHQGKAFIQSLGVLPIPAGPLSPEALLAQQQAHAQAEQERQAKALHAQAEIARARAKAQSLQWLQALGRVSAADSVAALGTSTRRSGEREDQFLYVLRADTQQKPPQLRLSVQVSYQKVAGGWAKLRGLRDMPGPHQPLYQQASQTDRDVLDLVKGMMVSPGAYGAYSYGARLDDGVALRGPAAALALQMAASTGRLFAGMHDGQPGQALQWGAERTLVWRWDAVSPGADGQKQWALRACLEQDGAVLYANAPPLYLDAAQGLCGPVQVPGVSPAQLQVLLTAPVLQEEVLQAHSVELLQGLGPLPAPPGVHGIQKVDGGAPRALLHLAPTPAAQVARQGLLSAQLRFDYQGHCGWWAGQPDAVLIDSAEGRLLLRRTPEAERQAIERLLALGLHPRGDGGDFGLPGAATQHTWLQWADSDFAALRSAGFEVFLDDALQGWLSHADDLQVQLQPHGQGDGDLQADTDTSPWFDLSLGMEINGQRHNILPWLPDLLAAVADLPLDSATAQPQWPPFVYLPSPWGEGFVRVPTEPLKPWLAALLDLVGDRQHDLSGQSLRLSRLEALRTSAALGEGVVWDGAQALRTMVQQLQGATHLPDVAVPASVQADLRPYQRHGLNWLQFLRAHGLSGILADDMGLGKTLQTLVHIQVEKDAGRLACPALIVAPVSLMGNWQREAARFCPQLRCLVWHGKERHALADAVADHDVVVAPYSLLQRDREHWLAHEWHLVVLDEAQNIKNASTHAAQVVGDLQSHHRLCLSGTPMENHLGEIWSLFHFLMPGFLASQKRFGELFRAPIEKLGDTTRLAQLRARVTPFMLRRTKDLVAHELPAKIETLMPVELEGKQADLYETIRLGMEKTVRDALQSKGLAKSQITILDALLKLRQVCCDPRLVPLEAAKKVKNSAKLEQLMDMLPEMLAEGRRILLFSQFTSMLNLIEAELKKRQLPWVKLTGQSQKRDAIIERFTSGEVPLFLISLKAGGVGLNLPQADTVIHYDPWWNPAVENQATDRAHRIGQLQNVWVVKLVAQGTIEERILALQERKAQLADSLYSGAAARREPMFTESDLAELFKPLSKK